MVALASAPFVFADIERLVPADSAVLLGKIENLSAMREKAAKDALAAEFDAKFFTPLFEGVENEAAKDVAEDKDIGVSEAQAEIAASRQRVCSAFRAFSEEFGGEALLVVSDFKSALFIADCRDDFDLNKAESLLNGIGKALADAVSPLPDVPAPNDDAVPAPNDDETLMRAEAEVDADEAAEPKAPEAPAPLRDDVVAGVPVKILPAGRDGGECIFAIYDKKFFLSCNREALATVLAVAKVDAGAPDADAAKKPATIVDSDAFKKARERIGDADCWFYSDGAALAAKAYAFAAALDETAEQRFRENPNSFMILATPFVKSFAPEAIESVWACWTLDAARNYPSESAIVWKEKKGIVAALVADALKPGFEKPAFLPRRDDVVSVSAGSWSLGNATLKTLDLLRASSPIFGLLDLQFMNLKASTGFDVPAAISAFGNGAAKYSWGVPKKTIGVLTVSDETLVAGSFEKLADAFGQSKPKAVDLPNGAKVFIGGDGEYHGGYVFVGGKLCIGNEADILEFASFADGNAAPESSVWNDPDFVAAEAMLPAGGCGISFTRLGLAVKNFGAKLCGDAWNDPAEETRCVPARSADIFDGIRKLGPNDFDYTLVEKTYLGENELTARGIVLKNK